MAISSTNATETGGDGNINPQNEQDIPSGQNTTNVDDTTSASEAEEDAMSNISVSEDEEDAMSNISVSEAEENAMDTTSESGTEQDAMNTTSASGAEEDAMDTNTANANTREVENFDDIYDVTPEPERDPMDTSITSAPEVGGVGNINPQNQQDISSGQDATNVQNSSEGQDATNVQNSSEGQDGTNEQNSSDGQDTTNDQNTTEGESINTTNGENSTDGSENPARRSLLDDYADLSTEMPDYI